MFSLQMSGECHSAVSIKHTLQNVHIAECFLFLVVWQTNSLCSKKPNLMTAELADMLHPPPWISKCAVEGACQDDPEHTCVTKYT